VLVVFRLLFPAPTWRKRMTTLLTGTLLVRERRTVAAALCAMNFDDLNTKYLTDSSHIVYIPFRIKEDALHTEQ
ncbi:MAG: hypothetical protein ACRDHZ_17550, partial [Ktedonobacteraceae bacterium]